MLDNPEPVQNTDLNLELTQIHELVRAVESLTMKIGDTSRAVYDMTNDLLGIGESLPTSDAPKHGGIIGASLGLIAEADIDLDLIRKSLSRL